MNGDIVWKAGFGFMLEITLILILVVIAMVAIIVNRKSLLACIVITVVSSMLGLGFLLLYANADKFASHEKLLSFTITLSAVIILALLVVTYIGVKMHFKKFTKLNKRYVPEPAQGATGEPMLIPGTQVYAKAVGIFGRKPIIVQRHETVQSAETTRAAVVETAHVVREPQPQPQPVVTPAPERTPAPVPVHTATEVVKAAAPSADSMLKRMLDKAEMFKKAGQYVLAEQMYVTYIARCPDNASRADGELLMLDCRILAGNIEGSKEQLNDLLTKLRSGEYQLTQEQKKQLADCKLSLMKLQQGK